MKAPFHLTIVAAVALSTAGCSTFQRTAVTAVGAAAGGAGAYALARHNSPGAAAGYTALGAAGGALIAGIAQGKDKKAIEEGYQAGYQQAQSDAIKREYWLRQERERAGIGGSMSYYTVPVLDDTADVRHVPHTVTLPVVE